MAWIAISLPIQAFIIIILRGECAIMMLTNARLYNKRVEKILTRRQLAEFAGVSWETIKSYEVKGATPSLQVAVKLAKALDTTIEDLFGAVDVTGAEPSLQVSLRIARALDTSVERLIESNILPVDVQRTNISKETV